jgi:NADPH-dependent 2,4-dienoyl-CoA reductase/sulfur reductase-like enzyme
MERVLLIDDNPGLGGQIWRGEERNPTVPEAMSWCERVRQSGVHIWRGARIFDGEPGADGEPGVLFVETPERMQAVRYSRLVIATGARERFLPFPGWTLPNVMGAGGLQAMVKSGLPIAGKRVVVAGTGPLLLAVATYLVAHGAQVCAIAEQAPLASLAWFAARLTVAPAKLVQALQFKRQLSHVPILTSCWPVAAQGAEKVESVTLTRSGRSWSVPCDYLACGFHLVPNVELAALLGCRIQEGMVEVDDFQRTTVANIYCAGEPTGIGGVELSMTEGQIAGLAAAGQQVAAQRHFANRRKYRRFAAAMNRAFALRPELRKVPPETILCRCEDVTLGRAGAFRSWREAKLHTRCGMGPCQGRVCGAACSFLFDWRVESVRPPVFPVPVSHLATTP